MIKMRDKNLLFIFFFISMNGGLFDLSAVNCEIHVVLSLTQIGQFVFAIRQEFFTQIAEHGTPNEGSNPKEHWTKKFRHELVNIGKKFGVSELINEQKRRLSLIRHYITKNCDQYCENINFDEKQCREMESQIKARLTVRELIDMARKLVKHEIPKPFFIGKPNFMTKLKMYIWWYRFRYRVDSAVTFEGSARKSEFRLGIVQYYYEMQETFQGQIEKIGNELAWLKEAIDKLDTIPYNVTVEPHTTDDEQYNFDPFNENEMSQGNAFHRGAYYRNNHCIGHATEGQSANLYCSREISNLPKNWLNCRGNGNSTSCPEEFHYGNQDGALISDKIRRPSDPERGIKLIEIGTTKKSIWEVQKIFDQLSDFYMENGEYTEAKFGMYKYDVIKNNCIHFVRIFAEKLIGTERLAKLKNWPPKIL